MPSSAIQHRVSTGCFVSVLISLLRKKADSFARRHYYRGIKVRRAQLSKALAALLFALLVVHGVESNPGPKKSGGGSGSENGGSGSDNAGGGASRSASRSRQSTLNLASSSSNTIKEPSLSDIMAKLISLEGMKEDVRKIGENMASMTREIQSINKNVSILQAEVDNLTDQVDHLEKQNRDLGEENDLLNERLQKLEKNTESLDCQMRKNNLVIYGMQKETENEKCEDAVCKMLNDKMGMRGVEFDHAYRLGDGAKAPIMVKCKHNEDKTKILKSKLKLKGTEIFIEEDYTSNVRETRKTLLGIMKDMRKEGTKVRLAYDYLVVEGEKMFLDKTTGRLTDKRQ